jgi:hypothetical protein
MSDYFFLVCPNCGAVYDEGALLRYNLDYIQEVQEELWSLGFEVHPLGEDPDDEYDLKDAICLSCGDVSSLKEWLRTQYR